jgi:hypothetical protein
MKSVNAMISVVSLMIMGVSPSAMAQANCADPAQLINGKPLISCTSTGGCISNSPTFYLKRSTGKGDNCTFLFSDAVGNWTASRSGEHPMVCRYFSKDCNIYVDLQPFNGSGNPALPCLDDGNWTPMVGADYDYKCFKGVPYKCTICYK